jgi:phage tail sheath gpL-like
MKAIIIDEKDACALLDQLKLAKFEDAGTRVIARVENISPEMLRSQLLDEMHRHFHYVVCRWLQEQGASCVR